jgi:serine/threonine protein kinase
LKGKYLAADEESIDFLLKILVSNPYSRISVDNCLAHPLFSKVRAASKQEKMAETIALDFEKDDLSREKLRELILLECQHYRKLSIR